MKAFDFGAHRERLRKILVVELLGLGDNVQLLPALNELRAALPQAQLQVMARAHVADLFVATPWVDRVWRYPVIPRKPNFAEHRALIAQLRAERFDLVLNSSSNDRSGWITGFSGAPLRVGRVPRKGRLLHWRLMHNREISARYSDRPMWLQKLEALRAAGVPALPPTRSGRPHFNAQPPPWELVDARVRALAGQSYLHVSPFASEDRRGLRDAQVAATLNALAQLQPARAIVVSLGPGARESRKWQAVAPLLRFEPAALFAGDLDTVSFLRLVSGAALHLGPDSGGVHVARLFGVPTVSWIRQHRGTPEWIADEPGSEAFVSSEHDEQGVLDISPEQLLQAAQRCLRD